MNTRKRHVGNGNSYRLRLIKYAHWLVTVAIFFVFWLRFRYPNGMVQQDIQFVCAWVFPNSVAGIFTVFIRLLQHNHYIRRCLCCMAESS